MIKKFPHTYQLFHVDKDGMIKYQANHASLASAKNEFDRDRIHLANGDVQEGVVEICVYKNHDEMVLTTTQETT